MRKLKFSAATRGVAVLLVGGLCGPVIVGAAPASAESGAWQKHEYSFAFFGFTTTYSCDGLADKLKILLVAAGARGDAKATSGACAAGFGRPDKFASADLVFYTLAPDPADAPRDDPAAAAGAWRQIMLAAHSPRELQVGDCELVEQFAAKVLPLFATRAIVNRTVCVPHQESGSLIDLKFDAFAAARAVTANSR
jgi:hypothetical protein